MSEPGRHRIAAVADLAPGEVRHFAVDGVGEGIALCNVDGAFHAVADMCTHQYAVLSEGHLDADLLICPLHGGAFEVASGEAVMPPCIEGVKSFPVEVDGEDVYVIV